MSGAALSFAYAALLAAGGAAGYVTSRSTASLAAGVGSGVFFALTEYAIRASPALASPVSAAQALAASALAYVMGARFAGSGKFMPAGLVAALSAAALLAYGARAVSRR